jgi:uracil phosphoribosyltransferase/adenylate kinase
LTMQTTNTQNYDVTYDRRNTFRPSGSDQRPESTIVGLYGVSGSGKSFILEILKQSLGQEPFVFYDGSQVIAAITPGGLEAFQKSSEDFRANLRERAIKKIKEEARDSGKVAIVAGHAMLWPDEKNAGQWVCTSADLECYTHIVYLNVPPETIAEYRLNDREKRRPSASVTHLEKWQEAEMKELRHCCRSHHITFSTFAPNQDPSDKLISLLRDLHQHTEDSNTRLAEKEMDKVLATGSELLETVLVLDADKTLAPQDSGELFWETLPRLKYLADTKSPLKELFSGTLQYSYTAFRQATMLCEEAIGDKEYIEHCKKVAQMITMHQDLVYLLRLVAGQAHIRAIVLTCGIRGVWEKVLDKEKLSSTVAIIGGGRLSDGLVMTPKLKEKLVMHIRSTYNASVWAFGDSPLDLGMLTAANQAVVITGERATRSTSMDDALAKAIKKGGFHPRQVLLPRHAPPRLDSSKLPVIQLSDHLILNPMFTRRNQLHVVDGTHRSAAKLLMTPMRNASMSGPALREAHRRVGWYLATEFCAEVVGVETFAIPHVQGHQTDGYRVLHEKDTLIVALMRGGEPMALGISDALPSATFVHAKLPTDILPEHLSSTKTILLVDSVVNSGKSILEFVRYIRKVHATVRIIVIAGVIQSKAVMSSAISQELCKFRCLSFVALRLSENQFTGRGGTDTGNRLFNTTDLV